LAAGRGRGRGRFRRPRPRLRPRPRPLYEDYYDYNEYYYDYYGGSRLTDYDYDYDYDYPATGLRGSSGGLDYPATGSGVGEAVEGEEVVEDAAVKVNKKKKKNPFVSEVEEAVVEEEEALPDLGVKDYDVLIKELWRQFLKEKTGGGGGGGGSRRRPVEEEYECPPAEDSYYKPDDEQCDRYFECNIKGEIKEHLCPDGFVFDINLEKCDYPVKVNCTGRPLLQEPQPSVNCSRANGFFPWPANISCQNFWDCREGTAYQQTCPVGVIFDPGLNTCATPDQSSRTECKEGESNFLGFSCPNYTPESVLRFGNHDRLPHPDDCQKYFSCLRTGGPRLATCPRKTVFNSGTGHCDEPKGVPGCEEYWILKLGEDDDDDYYYD